MLSCFVKEVAFDWYRKMGFNHFISIAYDSMIKEGKLFVALDT